MVWANNFSTNVLKFSHLRKRIEIMTQKIYFGSVEILNTKTKQKRIIENQVFKENDNLNDNYLRSTVLKGFSKRDKKDYIIVKLDFDKSKQIGTTLY